MKDQYWLEQIADAEGDGRFLIEVTVHNTEMRLIVLTREQDGVVELTHADIDQLIQLLKEAQSRAIENGGTK